MCQNAYVKVWERLELLGKMFKLPYSLLWVEKVDYVTLTQIRYYILFCHNFKLCYSEEWIIYFQIYINMFKVFQLRSEEFVRLSVRFLLNLIFS
jgi:hypothetical protein